jgi:hypothetical protein
LGGTVAVKVVTLGMAPAQRDEMIEAATHEVKLLQSLHHPNIVRVVLRALMHCAFMRCALMRCALMQ